MLYAIPSIYALRVKSCLFFEEYGVNRNVLKCLKYFLETSMYAVL